VDTRPSLHDAPSISGDQVIQYHIRNISERKRAEFGAAVLVDELAAADRSKDEFLAMLSHELRNALAPLGNALRILHVGQENGSPIATQTLALMGRQLVHMAHLVDDLHAISSIGPGRMRLHPGMVDLRAVVQRSVEAVTTAYAHRQHRVTIAVPDEPVWLDADVIRLEQVVVNLMSNAASYTTDGGSIAISVGHFRDRAELRVVDNGIGIEPEMLPKVFDLFARGDNARTHSRHGQGIGLNIVKRIVDLHGGTVEARSAGRGTGSEFVVSLPLVFPLTL
jgi:signal transduction histidine kinase